MKIRYDEDMDLDEMENLGGFQKSKKKRQKLDGEERKDPKRYKKKPHVDKDKFFKDEN